MKRITYTKEDFKWTQWTPEDIRALAPQIIEKKKKAYEEIKKVSKEDRTFENTVYGIESSDDGIDPLVSRIDILMNTSPDKEIRDIAKEIVEYIQKEFVDIEYDEKIYKALKDYAEKNEKLDGEDRKLLEDMMRGYKRMGFELPKDEREKLKELIKESIALGTEFSKNVNEYKDEIIVTREELDGLPEHYISGLRQDKGGNYIVSLDYPEIGPFIQYAKNADRRRELLDKDSKKGGIENLDIAKKMLNTREKVKDLLEYETYADYVTEERMAKSAANVQEFIDDLMPKLKPLSDKEMEELTSLKRDETGDSKAELFYYDTAYYSNILLEKKYSLDTNKLKEYFPFAKVKDGVFKIYSTLFSVEFEKLEGYDAWHPDVEFYAVKNNADEIISYFMLDLYPREGKYGHAAVSGLTEGHRDGFGEDKPFVSPIACMMTNFPKPTKENPSLMSHGEVNTFFHEFGHIVHHMLTTSKYSAQSGTSVYWDFVEAPSQMLENWVFDKEMLKLLSEHYKTGEALTDKMIDSLIKAKKHMVASGSLRQFIFASFDLLVHTKGVGESLDKEWKELAGKWSNIKPPEGSLFPASFDHIFGGGYAAGYYGYMWSKVYATDMFTRFKKEGLLNPKTGGDYRKWILEKGSSMEEMDLIKGFLGREPNNKAFLDEIGL